LDASIESLHAVTLWLGHKSADKLVDCIGWADAASKLFLSRLELYGVTLEAFKQRRRILEARLDGLTQQAQEFNRMKEAGQEVNQQQEYELSVSILRVEGKKLEMDAWIEWAEKYPKIERPDQLPTTENTPAQDTIPVVVPDEAEAKRLRQDVYRDQAIELADMLPERQYGRADSVE
jgi:hypothetical protein